MENEFVTISRKEYDELQARGLRLTCLENAGVDNWEWYGDAMDEYSKIMESEEEKAERLGEERAVAERAEIAAREDAERKRAEEEEAAARAKHPLKRRDIIQEVNVLLKKRKKPFSLRDMQREYLSIIKERNLESTEFIEFWEARIPRT